MLVFPKGDIVAAAEGSSVILCQVGLLLVTLPARAAFSVSGGSIVANHGRSQDAVGCLACVLLAESRSVVRDEPRLARMRTSWNLN